MSPERRRIRSFSVHSPTGIGPAPLLHRELLNTIRLRAYSVLTLFACAAITVTNGGAVAAAPRAESGASIERTILNMPDSVTNATSVDFDSDGNIIFAASPVEGGRNEIYRMSPNGADLQCLSCGVAPDILDDLGYAVPFMDGSGRFLVSVADPTGATIGSYSVLQRDGAGEMQLVPIVTPPVGAHVLDPQRFMVVSPDGEHVAFSQFSVGKDNYIGIYPVVGRLVLAPGAVEYRVDDARVVWPVGEIKDFTPDGRGVMLNGGAYDAGTADDIVVDLATGEASRITANLDFTEDVELSPNQQWIAVGSARTTNALTAMSRIVRPAFLPPAVIGPVYETYARGINVTNQVWVVAADAELNRENGLALFDFGDGYTSRSGFSWNADGSAVLFLESRTTDPTEKRIVIATLTNTNSVGPVPAAAPTPAQPWAPPLKTFVPVLPPMMATGTYAGAGGGSAVVTEDRDQAQSGHIIRTVTYTNYVNEDGMVLNGTESTNASAEQSTVHYTADIAVTGTHTGSLTADATVANMYTMTGYVSSELDGDVQTLLDPANVAAAQANA